MANSANTEWYKTRKMFETLAHVYSSESTRNMGIFESL